MDINGVINHINVMITDLYGGFHSHGTSIAGWFISSEDNMDYFAVPLKKHQFLNRLF